MGGREIGNLFRSNFVVNRHDVMPWKQIRNQSGMRLVGHSKRTERGDIYTPHSPVMPRYCSIHEGTELHCHYGKQAG